MSVTPIDENLNYYYAVVGSVIEKDGKFLLVQEKQKKCYEKWSLPGGKVAKGKTFKETAIREAKEETGFDIEIIKEIDIFHKDGDISVRHAYEARIAGGELKFPKDEILDAKWFTYEEVQELDNSGKTRSDWVLKSVEMVSSK